MADPRHLLTRLTGWQTWVIMSIVLAVLVFGTKLFFTLKPFFIEGAELRLSDFYVFWSVGQIIHDMGAAAAFEQENLNAKLNLHFEPSDGDTGFGLFWLYPPTILPYIWPFGFVSAPVGLLLFLAVSIFVWVQTVRHYFKPTDGRLIYPVLFAPIVFVTLAFEQNGIFTACILIAFIYAVKDKANPWWIGLLAMLMLYKPHFGMLMPVVLLLERNYKAFFASAVLCILYLLAVTFAFGIDYWQAFFAKHEIISGFVREGRFSYLSITALGFFQSMQLPNSIALYLHIGFAVFIFLCFLDVWRRGDWDLRIAMFLMVTLLLPPYAAVYDFTASAFVIGLLYPYFNRHRYGAIYLLSYWIIAMAFRTEGGSFDILPLPLLNAVTVVAITYIARKGIKPVAQTV